MARKFPLEIEIESYTQATTGATCWGITHGYDPYANLLTIAAKATHPSCVQNSNLSVGVTTANQINNSGFVYDAAGNLTNTPNPGGLTMVYDAENRMTSTAGVTYTYDGDGKRVKKTGGQLYWYGLSSDALVESDMAGSVTDEYVFFGGKRVARRQNPSGTIHYYAGDHLGTSRVVMGRSGQHSGRFRLPALRQGNPGRRFHRQPLPLHRQRT